VAVAARRERRPSKDDRIPTGVELATNHAQWVCSWAQFLQPGPLQVLLGLDQQVGDYSGTYDGGYTGGVGDGYGAGAYELEPVNE
jgi:hypothetical protein